MQVEYRILNNDDLTSYRKIRVECLTSVPDNFGTLLSEELAFNDSKFKKFISHPGKDGFFFGAFIVEKMIGICGWITEGRAKTAHRGELVQVFIRPENWRMGIGKILLSNVIQKAFENQKIDQILLSAVRSNDKATGLYEKLGFTKYGEIDNYFNQGKNSWSQIFMKLTREKFESIIQRSPLAPF